MYHFYLAAFKVFLFLFLFLLLGLALYFNYMCPVFELYVRCVLLLILTRPTGKFPDIIIWSFQGTSLKKLNISRFQCMGMLTHLLLSYWFKAWFIFISSLLSGNSAVQDLSSLNLSSIILTHHWKLSSWSFAIVIVYFSSCNF